MHVSILNLSLVLHILYVCCESPLGWQLEKQTKKRKEKVQACKHIQKNFLLKYQKKIWSFFSIRKVLLHKFFMILAIIEKFGDSQMKKINEKMKKNDVYFSAMFCSTRF